MFFKSVIQCCISLSTFQLCFPAQPAPQLPDDAPQQGVGERRDPDGVQQREQRVRPHPQRGEGQPIEPVDLGRDDVLAAKPTHVSLWESIIPWDTEVLSFASHLSLHL